MADSNTPDNTRSGQTFFDSLSGIVNQEDITAILKEQKDMLQRMEKSNQMLMGCNNIAERQQQSLLSQLRHHTVLLQEMKKDLHSVFIRIRRLKAVLQERNPEVWSVIDSDEKAAGRSTEPASS